MVKNIIPLLALILSACGAQNAAIVSNEESMNEQSSSVITFNTIALQLNSIKTKDNYYLLESFEINLSIDLKNESYTGNSGCNSFFGKVEMVGQDKLLFRVGGITEMMCEQSVMEWESRFLNALMESEFTVNESGKTVLFSGDEGIKTMSFTRIETAEE